MSKIGETEDARQAETAAPRISLLVTNVEKLEPRERLERLELPLVGEWFERLELFER